MRSLNSFIYWTLVWCSFLINQSCQEIDERTLQKQLEECTKLRDNCYIEKQTVEERLQLLQSEHEKQPTEKDNEIANTITQFGELREELERCNVKVSNMVAENRHIFHDLQAANVEVLESRSKFIRAEEAIALLEMELERAVRSKAELERRLEMEIQTRKHNRHSHHQERHSTIFSRGGSSEDRSV